MNKKQFTLIHFDYGGHYLKKRDEVLWISREDVHHTLLLKKASEEVTYTVMVEQICKKIGLDEDSAKVKFSYIPLNVDPKKPVYILDDDDVFSYLELYEEQSVLHVEIVKNHGQNMACDILPREGISSQVGASIEDLISSARGNCRVDCGIMNQSASEPSEHYAMVVHDEERGDLDACEREGLDNIACEREDLDNIASERGDLDNIACERGDLDNLFINEDIVVTHSIEGGQAANLEWEDGMDVYIGQEFSTKGEVQELVEKAGHLNCFEFYIDKSDTKRYVVKCFESKKGCKWALRATKCKNSDNFSIRTYHKIHTCSRASSSTSTTCRRKRRGTPRLVASLLHDDFPGILETPSPKILMGLVQGRYGCKVSYSTTWRGKKKACNDVRGSPEDSYAMLYSYMYMLEKVNPGTVTYVELDDDQRFKYLFFALGACIEGFAVMRKVIIVDGTHLKHVIGGVLIVATAQDPDHHHYPIAFGVVDGEKDSSLTWFFNKLKSLIPDSGDLVFVTDRNVSLINSIAEVYPLSRHGYCIFHMAQNVKNNVSYVNKENLGFRFMECAQVYTECEFDRVYGAFRKRYPSAGTYLDKSCKETWKWARCYFPGERYDIYTTNTVESINSVFKEARKYSLLPMIDLIIEKLSYWFNKHRNTSTEDMMLVPFIETMLHPLCAQAKLLEVTVLNNFFLLFNVHGKDGRGYLVDLKMKTCACKHFDIDKYPCVHAIAALMEARKNAYTEIQIHDLCSKYYWMSHWALAYCRTIYPVPHMSQWNVPDHVREMVALPPHYVSKKGRHQVTRYPSQGEHRPRRRSKTGGLYSWFECSGSQGE